MVREAVGASPRLMDTGAPADLPEERRRDVRVVVPVAVPCAADPGVFERGWPHGAERVPVAGPLEPAVERILELRDVQSAPDDACGGVRGGGWTAGTVDDIRPRSGCPNSPPCWGPAWHSGVSAAGGPVRASAGRDTPPATCLDDGPRVEGPPCLRFSSGCRPSSP